MIRSLALILACLTTPTLAQQQPLPLETQALPLETQPLPLEAQPLPLQPQPLPAETSTAQPAQPGGASLRATHGDWEIRCVREDDCVMTQLHRRSQQSADAVFTIIKPRGLSAENGQPIEAFAEIVVPLGVYLPGGLGLKVDQQPAKAAPFERCIDAGCIVRAPLSGDLLSNMKTGNTAFIVIFGGPEQPVQVPISLSGFTAAFDSF